ncbi:MAG: hypothetical protein FJ241_12835, partial [Nitrospira sp.]|nr:hypothetical protein [Nitrospira sp.]
KDCKAGVIVQTGNSPTIENNTLINNDIGIQVNSDSSPNIRNNTISSPNGCSQNWVYQGKPHYFTFSVLGMDHAMEGIRVIDSSSVITKNKISQCNGAGISIVGNCSPSIEYNQITDCNNGIHFLSSFTGSPEIHNNNIYNNSIFIGLDNGITASIDAKNNWWGTIDDVIIRDKIRDIYHSQSSGTVIYIPILEEPVKIDS